MLGGGRSDEFPDGASGAATYGILLAFCRAEWEEYYVYICGCESSVAELRDVCTTSFTFCEGSDCPYTESGSGSCENDDF